MYSKIKKHPDSPDVNNNDIYNKRLESEYTTIYLANNTHNQVNNYIII